MNKLVNAKEIMQKALQGNYAIPHINTNNLEWTKAILIAAEKMRSPIIIGTSEGAIKYMGGQKLVVCMVRALIEEMKITVPVVLHLDHGSYQGALEAIKNGYSSVMFDGSHLPFEENLRKTKEVVEIAKSKDISVEAEVGTIGGEEDGIIGTGEIANPDEAKLMKEAGVDILAAGIGNIHGPYPPSWKTLDFNALKSIKEATSLPLVLHGGSGIPEDQIKKSIQLGINKINVNTELQLVFAKATREYIEAGKDREGKGFDPRKLLAPGVDEIIKICKEKIIEFGSANKA